LHGHVSRQLFGPLFPRWPTAEVPVEHVTNGVHMPTWDSAVADDIWTEACGKQRWMGGAETLEHDIRRMPDARLWQFRTEARISLVDYARNRLSRQLAAYGTSSDAVDVQRLFDSNTLTLGFARRFATYKRPNLLLHDPERLLRLLNDQQRPVQLIIAGKAHPADQAGQAMIQEWMRFVRRTEARPHVVFLSDYDMHLTEELVQGVDVWLNTPRRPWEACGTSGMKVLVNGGLNLSELDGWWAEAYTPDIGWALGDGQEHDDASASDAIDAEALYDLLEQQVVPEFYTRDERGIPQAWVTRIRESMARLTPRFSTNRTVGEYTERFYLPQAAGYRQRAADAGRFGRVIANWQRSLDQHWGAIRFGELTLETDGDRQVFEVHVHLGELDPDAVCVELFAEPTAAGSSLRQAMQRGRALAGVVGGYVYRGEVPANCSPNDYTARVIPHCAGVAVPLEAPQILWQC
jgi:starch phosphorylase